MILCPITRKSKGPLPSCLASPFWPDGATSYLQSINLALTLELDVDDGHVDEGDPGEGGGDLGAVGAAHGGGGEGRGRQEHCKVMMAIQSPSKRFVIGCVSFSFFR